MRLPTFSAALAERPLRRLTTVHGLNLHDVGGQVRVPVQDKAHTDVANHDLGLPSLHKQHGRTVGMTTTHVA